MQRLLNVICDEMPRAVTVYPTIVDVLVNMKPVEIEGVEKYECTFDRYDVSEYGVAATEELKANNTVNAKMLAKSLGVEMEITPEETGEIAKAAGMEPIADGVEWRAGLNLVEGTIVVSGGTNYLVIQSHISQADWPPTNTPALFTKLKVDYAPWEQPAGAHDAYMKGDKVSYEDGVWESDIDGNVWAPGVHGWTKIG